jgi:hypothetical protein
MGTSNIGFGSREGRENSFDTKYEQFHFIQCSQRKGYCILSVYSPDFIQIRSLSNQFHVILILSVLACESHLLVDNELSGHGVTGKSDSDTNDDTCPSLMTDTIP